MGCSSSSAAGAADPKQAEENGQTEVRTPAQERFPFDWPSGAEHVGYLTERQVRARLKTQPEHTVDLGQGFTLRWAAASQRGYYPSQADKANQDAFRVEEDMEGPKKHWFAVYDGHGPVGEKCSRFACEHVAMEFCKQLRSGATKEQAMSRAHTSTNTALAQSAIDDQQSGTTAVTAYFDGLDLLVSNVGDSRVMLGSVDAQGKLIHKALSTDQTPYRRDERERVKACGARVMTADQIDGVEPIHEVRGPVSFRDVPSRRWRGDHDSVAATPWMRPRESLRVSPRRALAHAIAATAPRVFRSRAGLGLRFR